MPSSVKAPKLGFTTQANGVPCTIRYVPLDELDGLIPSSRGTGGGMCDFAGHQSHWDAARVARMTRSTRGVREGGEATGTSWYASGAQGAMRKGWCGAEGRLG